jgi:hypothetical protein
MIMAQPVQFKRIVLGLPYSRPAHGMRLAADIASLLNLDLFGFFVEEESLRGIAALPFVREFQILGGGWRPLDVDRLSRDLETSAKRAERAFMEAAKKLRTTCQFETMRGSLTQTIVSISRASDIVLVVEPESAAERATPHFHAILDAAFRSAAAVLLVPGRIARYSGAIVAIASGPDDPSVEVAKAIAAAADEDLVVIETSKSATPIASNIATALQYANERLVVMTRQDDNTALAVASMRKVPILIVEPERSNIESEPSTRSAA